VNGEALATLVVKQLHSIVNALAIKAPGFVGQRNEVLRDMAVLMGGTVVSEELGKKLDAATLFRPRPCTKRRRDERQRDDRRRSW
jgi:chaperonin GroEL